MHELWDSEFVHKWHATDAQNNGSNPSLKDKRSKGIDRGKPTCCLNIRSFSWESIYNNAFNNEGPHSWFGNVNISSKTHHIDLFGESGSLCYCWWRWTINRVSFHISMHIYSLSKVGKLNWVLILLEKKHFSPRE